MDGRQDSSPELEEVWRDSVPSAWDREECRALRVTRPTHGLRTGDLVIVARGLAPEGGELVVQDGRRVVRHGGGAVWGIVVGIVRRGLGGGAADRGGSA